MIVINKDKDVSRAMEENKDNFRVKKDIEEAIEDSGKDTAEAIPIREEVRIREDIKEALIITKNTNKLIFK
jgi:hypothetical protein